MELKFVVESFRVEYDGCGSHMLRITVEDVSIDQVRVWRDRFDRLIREQESKKNEVDLYFENR